MLCKRLQTLISAICRACATRLAWPPLVGQDGAMASPSRIDHFPHLHTRPALGWVNDPNGIGHWDGRWHVMYQWNPHAPRHADIHWGHMSSPDLLSWRDEGLALSPRPGCIDATGAWSGVAVATPEGVALVYTAVAQHARDACIAIARPGEDGAWRQPAVAAASHPDHACWAEVRDPFLFTVTGRRLGLMGAGRADEHSHIGGPRAVARSRQGVVLVYDADDLDHWVLLGPLVAADELPAHMTGAGAIWECPQLVRVGDDWMLMVSWDDGTGAQITRPEAGRPPSQGVTAFVGDLDLSGAVPRFVARTETALDRGPDFYAPQVVVDGERALAWAWAWEGRGVGSNRRSDEEIAESGWAGTLTFPRELVVDATGAARCVPASELAGLVGEPLAVRPIDGGWELRTSVPAWTLSVGGGAVQVDLVDAATGSVRPVWAADRPGPTRLFVDGSIVEWFDADGSTTVRAYPAADEVWCVFSLDEPAAAVLRVS
jgi:beta-fructofuranosidase